jgi:hypothetical protein
MADFSCYVTIVNQTNSSMTLSGTPVDTHGVYVTSPASEIAAGSSTSFQLQQTNALSPGPQGACTYAATDNSGRTGSIVFSYACPLTTTNYANAVLSGNTAVTLQMIPNPLPEYGHPVNVQFTVFG